MASEHDIKQFESISDAINYVFQFERTSLLSFDRICDALQKENLYYNSKKKGLIPCSSLSRRRISFVLSTSELFIRAGSEKTCMWALKPHSQFCFSDSVIRSSVEQALIEHGPMTVEQIHEYSGNVGVDISIYQNFFQSNSEDFHQHADQKYWFANQPLPQTKNFDNINNALVFAMNQFPQGASIEEVQWFLCLSTINNINSITRRSISRELSRRPDLFLHVSRARYVLNIKQNDNQLSEAESTQIDTSNMVMDDAYPYFDVQEEDDFFDPTKFFAD